MFGFANASQHRSDSPLLSFFSNPFFGLSLLHGCLLSSLLNFLPPQCPPSRSLNYVLQCRRLEKKHYRLAGNTSTAVSLPPCPQRLTTSCSQCVLCPCYAAFFRLSFNAITRSFPFLQSNILDLLLLRFSAYFLGLFLPRPHQEVIVVLRFLFFDLGQWLALGWITWLCLISAVSRP